MRRAKVRTDVSMKAHLGIRVPSGTGSGKLEDNIEYRSQRKCLGTYVAGVALSVQLNVHSE